MARWLDRFTNLFPLWALVCGCLALWIPSAFTWFNQDMIVWGLGIIMLGMGMTLSVDDFNGAQAANRGKCPN